VEEYDENLDSTGYSCKIGLSIYSIFTLSNEYEDYKLMWYGT